MLLESVASKTDHDQHVIHVFTHAHTIFSNSAQKESCTKGIRAVAEQRSSPELCFANKTKIHLKQKMNSKSVQYEDVLYFDLQSNPIACTLESEVMEWKQTLQGSYI